MKVILVNGSPNEKGCTYTALSHVAETLNEQGIDTEFFWLGTDPIASCISCGACSQTGKCVFDDKVNEFLEKAAVADGFVFGSPVHYASASGAMTAFMDRVFFSGTSLFAYKPGACVVSARRAGTTATLDQLNKYLTYSQMIIPTSFYWNMVHGFTPEDVEKDLEGVAVMRTLGRNMGWLLCCKEAALKAGIEPPKGEAHVMTNFIR